MNSLERIQKHHLNIYFDANEPSRELAGVWSRVYKEIEDMSHQSDIDLNPTVEFIPLSKGNALALIITGRDLFLGIYDDTRSTLSNSTKLDKILIPRGNKVFEIYEDLQRNDMEKFSPVADDIKHIAGSYITKVRREESIIDRLPQGLAIAHTNEPFVIEIRKQPPFTDHDYMFQINQNNGKCFSYIDGEQKPIDTLKETAPRVYKLFKLITDVCNGDNFKDKSVRTLLNLSNCDLSLT